MGLRPPRTYIDIREERFKEFCAKMSSIGHPDKKIDSGTTVVAVVSKDEKRAVIASDGRVSTDHLAFIEDFRKIYNCRIGFVGVAGFATLAQLVIPEFKGELNEICDARNRMITASGALRRLFKYQLAASQRGGAGMELQLIPLFWDHDEKKCYLYQLIGGCHFRRKHVVAIGSGVGVVGMDYDRMFSPTNSKVRLMNYARRFIVRASKVDQGTNRTIFYGIIDNGECDEAEEVL